MNDFPEEFILIFDALSKKECRELILKLWEGPLNKTEVDDKSFNPLQYAGMVRCWTKDFKEHYYEISGLGRAVINAITSVFTPKKQVEEGAATP